MAMPLIKQILNRIVGLENTNLNLSNQIKELLEKESFKAFNSRATNSWDEIALRGYSSIVAITGR